MNQNDLFNGLISPAVEKENQHVPKISELPYEEHPSYKIERYPNAMSARELLALLIGGENQLEVARHLYQACSGDLWKLGQECIPERINGIGKATSNRILAAVQLGEKLSKPTPMEKTIIHCPEDVERLVGYEMRALEQEQLRVILLNTRNHVLAVETIYQGTLNTSHVRVGELFREAIRRNAAAIIVIHSHPSGDPSPSMDDVALTRVIVEAGRLLDISALDHIIIGREGFVSLKRKGLGFDKEE